MKEIEKIVRSLDGTITKKFPVASPVILDVVFPTACEAQEAYWKIIMKDADAQVSGNKLHVVLD